MVEWKMLVSPTLEYFCDGQRKVQSRIIAWTGGNVMYDCDAKVPIAPPRKSRGACDGRRQIVMVKEALGGKGNLPSVVIGRTCAGRKPTIIQDRIS